MSPMHAVCAARFRSLAQSQLHPPIAMGGSSRAESENECPPSARLQAPPGEERGGSGGADRPPGASR
eukprot:8866908-Alexandrium_andersonii.AAC.1